MHVAIHILVFFCRVFVPAQQRNIQLPSGEQRLLQGIVDMPDTQRFGILIFQVVLACTSNQFLDKGSADTFCARRNRVHDVGE